MSSADMTPDTAGESSLTSNSRLPGSPPSSLSDSISEGSESNQRGGVSMTMREEEKKMRLASVREDEKRILQSKDEPQDQDGTHERAFDERFSKLEKLLSQSQIYARIMMDKMQKQQASAHEKVTKEMIRTAKKAGQAGKPAAIPLRRATRAAAEGGRQSTLMDDRKLEKTSQSTIPNQTPTRGRPRKKDAVATITHYFGKTDLESKAGNASVAEALLETADSYDGAPTAIGAQDLRSARQPDLVSGGIMRSYQLEGLSWLASLYENGLNGILADEMGLGKTIQTISFVAFLKEKGVHGPFLVVAPLSTLSNWIEEFAHWTPEISTVLYHGSIHERQEIRRRQLQDENSPDFPVVCTSFEICMNDQKFLSRYGWKYIVIDEGHRLKNLNCRLIKELKQYNSANRLLITGTPLQNNLAELWSLLNFLMPQIFDSLENFESWFDFSAILDKEGHKKTTQHERKNSLVSSLHAILKPFLLRRVKTDVESSLPKKREYILYAPLSTAQKELYRVIREGNSREYLLEKAVQRMTRNGVDTPKSTRSGSIKRKPESDISSPNKSAKSSRASTPASSLRSSRKHHSYKELSDREFYMKLAMSSESEEIDEEEQEEIQRANTLALARKQIASKKLQNPLMQLRLTCDSPHHFYWPWSDGDTPDESLVTESGKMILLDRLIPSLFSKGHKVLIFSQFTTQLDLMEDWATLMRGWNVCRIDGSVKQDDRRQQILAFNTNPDFKMFLLSTRAGGQGINLAAADTVILFDSDWNPQQDLQAQDRAHRIGQVRPVIVYRLATKGTVEQLLLEKADGKRRLEKLVIQKGKFKNLMQENKEDGDELQKILSEDDFEKYDVGESGAEILSDRDLEILTDRSEEAYIRAEKGLDGGDAFKAVETKAGGDGVLATLTK